MTNTEISKTQLKKGIIIFVVFIILRLIVKKIWDDQFNSQYILSVEFILFLLSVFLIMSVCLVYIGFSRWIDIDLKNWWFQPGRILGDIGWGVVSLLVVGVVSILVALLLSKIGFSPENLVTQQPETTISSLPTTLLLGWFFGFAIASFQEETIFRGFLQSVLERKFGKLYGIILQAALFSITHIGLEPLGSARKIAFFLLLRFVFGLVFGWLRTKRGSLLAPAIVHGFFG